MQTYIEQISSTLIERHEIYVQIFMVHLWNERVMIEFRFGYSLRRDSKLHARIVKVGAQEALTSSERRATADAMLAEIEDHIDETISATRLEVN